MRISQHKYLGKVTWCVLLPYNDYVQFQQHNYCFSCKLLYRKDTLFCIRCKRRLRTKPKEYVACLVCDKKLFSRRGNRDADLFVSRNNARGTVAKHYCIKCALRRNYISSDILYAYLSTQYIQKTQIYSTILNAYLNELSHTGNQPRSVKICH